YGKHDHRLSDGFRTGESARCNRVCISIEATFGPDVALQRRSREYASAYNFRRISSRRGRADPDERYGTVQSWPRHLPPDNPNQRRKQPASLRWSNQIDIAFRLSVGRRGSRKVARFCTFDLQKYGLPVYRSCRLW